MNAVTFPWPHKDLSPNSRGHWSKKSRAAKNYRLDCFYLSKEAKVIADWDGPVHLHIAFFPPDRRHRDVDNMLASIKSGLDGLAEALGVNDKRFVLHLGVSEKTAGTVVVALSRGIQ